MVGDACPDRRARVSRALHLPRRAVVGRPERGGRRHAPPLELRRNAPGAGRARLLLPRRPPLAADPYVANRRPSPQSPPNLRTDPHGAYRRTRPGWPPGLSRSHKAVGPGALPARVGRDFPDPDDRGTQRNADDINWAYPLVNALILAGGLALNLLGSRLRARRRARTAAAYRSHGSSEQHAASVALAARGRG